MEGASGLGVKGRALVGPPCFSPDLSAHFIYLVVLLSLPSALLQHRLLVQPPHSLPDEEGTLEDKRGPGEYVQSPWLGQLLDCGSGWRRTVTVSSFFCPGGCRRPAEGYV